MAAKWRRRNNRQPQAARRGDLTLHGEPNLQQGATNAKGYPEDYHTEKTSVAADPIFAAIENHQMLDKTWMDMERGADEAGLRTRKQRDLDRACAAAENAAWKMARTNPTTAAGTSALLTYITTRPITGLFELGDPWASAKSFPSGKHDLFEI